MPPTPNKIWEKRLTRHPNDNLKGYPNDNLLIKDHLAVEKQCNSIAA